MLMSLSSGKLTFYILEFIQPHTHTQTQQIDINSQMRINANKSLVIGSCLPPEALQIECLGCKSLQACSLVRV